MRKNMFIQWKRVIAALLVMTMIGTSVSLESLAAEPEKQEQQKVEDTFKKEAKSNEYGLHRSKVIESKKTKDSTTFDIGNGAQVTEFYSQDIRFKDEEGTLKDYDSSLVGVKKEKSKHGHNLKKYAYENKEGDKKQYFPKKLTKDTPLLMETEEYQIRFFPAEADAAGTTVQEAEVQEEEITDIYAEEKKVPLKVVYPSEDEKKNYQYTSLDNGIKEEIVLEEKPEENTFTSILEIPGLTIRKNITDHGMTIYDEDEMVAGIQAPNMNDATEEAYSEDIDYTLETVDEEAGIYKLTLTVSEEYLEDEDREYPVTIDPTLTWSTDSQVSDVYVLSKAPYNGYNFYESGITAFSLGSITQGVSRAYLSFASLSSLTRRYIESANLTLTECSSSQPDQTVQAYAVNASWNKTTLTWNNKPTYYTTLLSSIKTTGTYKKQYSLNLTTLIRNYSKNTWTNYGIMLKNSSETGVNAKFFGARHATVTYRPKLTVVHYDMPTTPTSATTTPVYLKKGNQLKASWAGVSSKALSYIQYRLTTYDPETKAETGNVVNYSTGTKLGTTGSGSATIAASSGWAEGPYKLVIRGVDKSGCAGIGKGAVFYIDGTIPTMYNPIIEPASTAESPVQTTTPTIRWSNAADQYFKQVECSIDGGAYMKIGTTLKGTYQIPEGKISGNGEHTIIVRAVDLAGNQKAYTKKYYLRETGIGFENYVPKEGTLTIKKEYGKNFLTWDTAKELTDNIYYRIYRGESANFVMNEASLAAEKVTKSYWTDINSISDKEYYYKIEAVRTNTAGEIEDKIVVDQTLHLTGTPKSELQKRTGQKPYRGYYSFATPTGNGTVEYSGGNLMYEQEDAVMPSNQLSFTVTRYYNSQLQLQGMFGNGWTDSLHKELLTDADGNIHFLDSDGSIYTFEKNGDSYSCAETKDYELVSGEIVIDDAEEPETAAPEYTYTIQTKENMLYRFGEDGKLMAVEEPNGTSLHYTYDVKGRLESVQTDAGKEISLTYDEATGFLQSIVLPDKTKLTYSYNSGNLVQTKHSSADGTESISFQYGYTADGMTSVTDAKGQKYNIIYASGKAQKVAYPNGETYNLAFGDGKTDVTKKNESGTVIYTNSAVYDKVTGKMLKEIAPDGSETTYEYGYSDNPYLVTKTKNLTGYEKLVNGQVTFLMKEVATETSYNEEQNVETETAEDGTVTEYTYDTNAGNTWTNDAPTLITSKLNGQLISKESIEYDVLGNPLKETDATDANHLVTTNNTYDDSGNVLASQVEEDKLETSLSECEYDEEGNLLYEKTVSGGVISEEENTYDEMGRVLKTTDLSTGEVTEYTYDFLGRVVKTVSTLNGKSQTNTSVYDANGTVISETDTAGIKTDYVYDSVNRVKSRKVTKGESITYTTTYGYETVTIRDGRANYTVQNASVEKEMYPNGDVASVKYLDQLGRTIREKSNGLYTDYTYDQSGQQVVAYSNGTRADASDGKIELTLYNEKGNQTGTIINPSVINGVYTIGEDTVVTSQSYDDKGNVIRETDGEGYVTEYSYDDSSRVVKITEDAAGTAVITKAAYTTDEENNTSTTTTTDAEGHQSEEVTDAAGLIKSTATYGDAGERIRTEYEYDSRGNQTKVIYENGAYQIKVYDERDLLVKSVSYNGNGTEELQTEYTYDAQYRQVKMVDYRKVNGLMTPYRYTLTGYDGFGRTAWTSEVDSASEPTEEVIAKHRITYHYDAEDKVTGIDYALVEAGGVEGLVFTYDENRWLKNVEAKIEGKDTTILVRCYHYDTQGRVEELTEYIGFTDNITLAIAKRYTYNDRNLVASMSYATGNNMYEYHAYEYDKNGNIIKNQMQNDTPNGSAERVNETRAYTYDALGRLTKTVVTDQKTSGAVTTNYSYDKAGNRTKKAKGTEEVTYTYNGLNQLVTVKTQINDTESGNLVYTYDENGNQTEERNLLTGDSNVYQYDAENRMAKTTLRQGVTVSDDFVQENLYNGNGQRIRKTENGKETRYFYQDDVVLYTTGKEDIKSVQNLLGLEGNVICAEKTADSTINDSDRFKYYLYNKDIQGSTISILNEAEEVELSYKYDDFGETEISGECELDNEICYTGGIYDQNTELYYLNARYYQPENGRFMTEDTYRGEVSEPDTWHLYVYCKNDPINYVDPSGHRKKLIGAGVQISASASVSYLTVGAGIEIIYFFKQIKSGMYAYCFLEGGGGIGERKIKKGSKQIEEKIEADPDAVFSRPSFSCAICFFAVFAEPYITSYEKYKGRFTSVSVGFWRVKGFTSRGKGIRTVGAGVKFGDGGISATVSYYWSLNDIAKKFNKYKKKIKKKAEKFFNR